MAGREWRQVTVEKGGRRHGFSKDICTPKMEFKGT
jgi:hypothetical protein